MNWMTVINQLVGLQPGLPPLAFLGVMLLNDFPELLVDERVPPGVVAGPGRDAAAAEGAAQAGLLHGRLEARAAQRVLAGQRHGLQQDAHADRALAIRQGRDGVAGPSHGLARSRRPGTVSSSNAYGGGKGAGIAGTARAN